MQDTQVFTIYPLSQWPDLYVDFINNFLTIDKWAEYYNMSSWYAKTITAQGFYTDNFSMND